MLIVAGALALLSIILLGAYKVSAQPSSIFFAAATATTTSPFYIGNGTATTTYQFDNSSFSSGQIPNMQTVDAITLYAQMVASSTATVYTIIPEYSNDNKNWYFIGSQGTASAAGVITVATSTSFTLAPQTTATTSVAIKFPSVDTAHERIVVSATGAAGSIYFETDLKKNPSTP
jgi:hypothetical protein